MNGVIKAAGVVAVLLLAGLGLLLTINFISFAQFQDLSVKGLAMVAIVGGAGAAISLLTKGNKTDQT